MAQGVLSGEQDPVCCTRNWLRVFRRRSQRHRSPPDVETMRMLRTIPRGFWATRLGPTTSMTYGTTRAPRVAAFVSRSSRRKSPPHSRSARQRSAGARLVGELAQMLSLAYANGLADRPDVRGLLLALPSSYLFVLLDQGAWLQSAYDPLSTTHAVGRSFRPSSRQSPMVASHISTAGCPVCGPPPYDGQTPPLSLVPTLSLPSLAATILN